MSTRKFIRAVQTTFSQLLKAVRKFTRSLIQWLLRGLLILGRQPAYGRAGFVLPTTVLLVMVVLLTVGSIVFRTYTRTNETISERQQRVIYNAATPAMDRARAKLEFLFDNEREPRYPGGVPSENVLMALMLNGATISGTTIPPFSSASPTDDPYTFEDERRLDIGTSYDGDVGPDNAWRYRADTDGDGAEDATVVYAIHMRLDEANQLQVASNQRLGVRADNLRVRNTPLSASSQGNPECAGGNAIQPQQGWLPSQTNSSILFKNFQVDAYVLPDRAGQPISTLEMQMDKQISRGNKWGAWFRYDMEIFPGPGFNWNGAMHTEGSVMVDGGNFTGYMISDPDSCLYTQDASEVTVAVYDPVLDGTEVVTPGFRGEFISGSMRDAAFEGGTGGRFHLWNGAGTPPINAGADIALTSTNDSVAQPGGSTPADYALDPVVLQTRGISQHRNPTVFNILRPDVWTNGQKNLRRLFTPDQPEDPPYVDDTFRADNRYGPKPRYNKTTDLDGNDIGVDIPATNLPLLGDEPGPGESTEAVGLDGYWERRARLEGLRLIVGQRLELGDSAGWGGPITPTPNPTLPASMVDSEALRPFTSCAENSNNTTRCSEARQRRTLLDNLAAVQSMAIYHASSGQRDTPVACMALTVHPGTAGTLERSSTFENLTAGISATVPTAFGGYGTATRPIISDFFRGRGTNGWEYEFRADWNATNYNNSNSTLRVALRNLAQFAGDPLGGAPSFTPTQDRSVHPYPSMSMWGDFSVLRRVLKLMDPVASGGSGRSYESLSPADKTTLHTATCMLGMLAYNLDYLAKFEPSLVPETLMGTAYDRVYNATPGTGASEEGARLAAAAQYYSGLRGAIRALVNGTSPLGVVEGVSYANAAQIGTQDTSAVNVSNYIGAGVRDLNFTTSRVNQPETYVRLLERWRDLYAGQPITTGYNRTGTSTGVAPTRDQLNQYIALAQLIITKEQVARDRNWGFFGATQTNRLAGLSRDILPTLDPAGRGISGTYGPPTRPTNGCFGMLNDNVGDSLRYLCSWRPRYPILYSLFPAEGFANLNLTAHGDVDRPFEEAGQQYVRDFRDSTGEQQFYLSRPFVNGGVQYNAIPQTQIATDLVSLPRTSTTDWRLPVEVATSPGRGTPLTPRDTLVKVCFNNASQICLNRSSGVAVGNQVVSGEEYWRVPFKDSALFNGREMMTVRTLDVNLNFMRGANKSLTNDFWLPGTGIIYAFREDSVSENSIVRPKNSAVTWTSCATEVNLRTDANCRMTIASQSAFSSLDPPISDDNQISPKPVDYYPDPDRRPHGFRLRRGADLRRNNDQGRGLSFISDDPVYIQGDFNLHNRAVGPEEEFVETAGANYETFYQRTNPNGNFARTNTDSWRPTEVLADAITILSDTFCDGSIQDGLTNTFDRTRYNCTGPDSSASSFQNQNRPNAIPAAPSTTRPGWQLFRANIADGFGLSNTNGAYVQGDSPIYISPNGNPWIAVSSLTAVPTYSSNASTYQNFSDGKSLNAAQCGQRVNSIIVSGLVPSRSGNSYGGLHNFPRFLESWGGDCNMFISGSLIQLNFSSYATAPFDQDSWEVGSNPAIPAESINYYGPPARRWGYDVGLQYAPAGPVARRFVTLTPTRNEFYSEPPANDPYMEQLRREFCDTNPTPRPARCTT